MKIDLSGRKAIVTGSTAGIGLAIAQGLARAGAAVVVNGRTQQRVDDAVRALQAELPDARFEGVAADVSTPAGSAALAARVADADILVNNAGTANPKPFFDLTDEDWLDMYQLNVMSGVRASRHYIPGMVRRGWGRVVFISSESALFTPTDMIDYGMTKTAQLAVSRGLAQAVAGSGVNVNAVLPGPTRSEIVNNWMGTVAKEQAISREQAEQNFLAATRRNSLLKRFTETTEVANLVVYLCSEQAVATTGAALRVDGGVVPALV